jgi:hypothetical protein
MITIFGNFNQFSEKMAIFLKKITYEHFFLTRVCVGEHEDVEVQPELAHLRIRSLDGNKKIK